MAGESANQSRRDGFVVHRISLATIDRIVAENLGPTRVRSKAQPEALFRQIAMYLAKNVGGWSTTRIGKFYNGRDHSTVCHAIGPHSEAP
jgi:chromosomal replication initiation ATPase DnaA